MKCPDCQENHKKRDGMVCSCGYQFALDPTMHNNLTDGKFIALINRASANGTYYFTENQLYAAYCHAYNKTPGCIWPALIISLIISCFFPPLLILSAIIFAALAVAYISSPPDPEITRKAIECWKKTTNKSRQPKEGLEKLIAEPRLGTPPPDYDENDIYDYGVEKVLIVSNRLLVDLLILNNFHADNQCLIISTDNYPDYIIPVIEVLAKENPNLQVYLLHDSTNAAVHLKGKIYPFLAKHKIIDLGIFEDDVKNMPIFKPIGAKKRNYQMEVDYIHYSTLSAMLQQMVQDQEAVTVMAAAVETVMEVVMVKQFIIVILVAAAAGTFYYFNEYDNEYDKNKFMEGRRLITIGKYDEGQQMLFKYLEDAPKGKYRSRASFFIAKSYLGLGNFEEAEKAFQKTIKDYRHSREADKSRYKLAMIELWSGNKEKAIRMLRDEAENPDSPLAPEAQRMTEYLTSPPGKSEAK
ncbi:MAG: tetratricopeptide repeat protein [Planctomycetota bacterium]|jgi:TolA-binding protein